jgi:hypothetical protein
MTRDDTRFGSGGARRIYRFHIGWSGCGRMNHFNLADATPHAPAGTRGTNIRHGGAHDTKAARAARSRSSAPDGRSHSHGRATESES